jgi:hypothetical protein
MFRVENADFIADKLAAELLPNQEFREVLKNSLEAVDRRLHDTGTSTGGRIEFDVDWSMHAATGKWYVACADNGDGMSRSELELYTTTLAVQGAGGKQSIRGNQGMGLKISGPTRHKNGVLIRSLKNGERTMVQIGWNGEQYGLIPIGPDGELVVQSSIDTFPSFILEQGSGTVVTFLGTGDVDNTFAPSDRSRGWLFRYLNGRFYRLSGDGVQVLVRVPTGDEVDWPHTFSEAGDRMRGEGGRSFNLSKVNGTADIWDQATRRLGDDWRGTVPVAGDPTIGIPPAEIHWWVLPTGPGSDVSSRTFSGGSVAVLFQNELHDWRASNQANPFFARLGVLYGKTRIAFVIEPKGETITSDFARAHVLVGGTPLFQSDAWLLWADQFRTDIPSRIRQAMADEAGKLQEEDPDVAKRIRDRLREVMQLLRPRRFKPTEKGTVRASGESISGAGAGSGDMSERASSSATRGRSASARGIGAVLSQMDDEGTLSTEVTSILKLRPEWVTEQESEEYALVNGNGSGLHDRAAALVGEDGRTAAMILMNRDFRGYQSILAAINEWANPEGDEMKATKIEGLTREWINQKMIEAVQGLRQLENGNTWLTQQYNDALSPVALTAAFMADRYHTLREVKRAVGALRQTVEAAS